MFVRTAAAPLFSPICRGTGWRLVVAGNGMQKLWPYVFVYNSNE